MATQRRRPDGKRSELPSRSPARLAAGLKPQLLRRSAGRVRPDADQDLSGQVLGEVGGCIPIRVNHHVPRGSGTRSRLRPPAQVPNRAPNRLPRTEKIRPAGPGKKAIPASSTEKPQTVVRNWTLPRSIAAKATHEDQRAVRQAIAKGLALKRSTSGVGIQRSAGRRERRKVVPVRPGRRGSRRRSGCCPNHGPALDQSPAEHPDAEDHRGPCRPGRATWFRVDPSTRPAAASRNTRLRAKAAGSRRKTHRQEISTSKPPIGGPRRRPRRPPPPRRRSRPASAPPEGVEQQGQRSGHQHRRADPLNDPEGDQGLDRPGRGAGSGSKTEDQHPGREDSLAPDPVGQPAKGHEQLAAKTITYR